MEKIYDLTKFTDQKKYEALEDFILDTNKEMAYLNGVFGSFKNKNIIVKIPLENHFTQLFLGDANDFFRAKDLKYSGIYDEVNKVIFDTSFELCQHFGNHWTPDKLYTPKEIQLNTYNLMGIRNTITEELNMMLTTYARENEQNLMVEASSKFQLTEEYRFKQWKERAIKVFLQHSDYDSAKEGLQGEFQTMSKVLETNEWANNKIISDYFRDKDSCLKKEFDRYIEIKDAREDVGYDLLVEKFSLDILEDINLNKNNAFDLEHRKREIYGVLKDHPSVTLNITISYDNHPFTFKFERKDLIRCVGNPGEYDVSSWGKPYAHLHEYLKEHKTLDEYSYHSTDFDIMNIQEIKYRNEVLFQTNEHTIQKEEKSKSHKKLMNDRGR